MSRIKITDKRPRNGVQNLRTEELPNGFFVDKDGALWFKDSKGAVLINARGTRHKLERVPVHEGTWTNPQPVYGHITIRGNR